MRKTPPGDRQPYDTAGVRVQVAPQDSAGMMAYRVVDDMAEHYLDLVDALDAEIDGLEELEEQSAERTRQRTTRTR